MSRSVTLIACTTLLQLCSLGQSSQPATDRLGSVFLNRLKATAGRGAIDCGITPSKKPDISVAACGEKAFQDKKPFLAGYTDEGRVLGFGYGITADSAGNVFVINYQFFPPFPAVVPNLHTRLADDNHVRITECIKPVRLDKTAQGILTCIVPVNRAESDKAASQKPLETTVCAILGDPSTWNNKLVRIRGYYSGNFEYSMLSGDGCKDALWFGYGGGSGPPSLAVYVSSGTRAGSEDADGKLILPIPVILVRDSKFDLFEKQVEAMAKADDESYRLHPEKFVMHCVTATFTGRIDGVSAEVHEFRKRNPSKEGSDLLGYGQMGEFEGQFILQSVQDDAALGICDN